MDLRHYKTFLKVCDTLSMTAAAEELFLTQPAVSQAIREMEEYYGEQLFGRNANKLYLTPCGKNLRKYLESLVTLNDRIEKKIWAYSEKTEVRCGFVYEAWSRYGLSIVSGFDAQNGEFEMIPYEGSYQVLVDLLINGVIDVLITCGNTIAWGTLNAEVVSRCKNNLVACRNSRYVVFGEGNAADILCMGNKRLPFLTAMMGRERRARFTASLERAQIHGYVKAHFSSFNHMFRAVEQDVGIALVPDIISMPDTLRVIRPEGRDDIFAPSDICMVTLKNFKSPSRVDDWIRGYFAENR